MDAVKALRKAGYPYLIIGLTGNVIDSDAAEYLDAGYNIVLIKPLSMHVLDLIIKFIQKNGCRSIPGYKLVDRENQLEWKQRN